MPQNGCCVYCKRTFQRSPYRPQQAVCSRPECQRRRRADYHRRKLEVDPEYRQVLRDSQKQWWDEHPHYQKQRRQQNPVLVESNRQRQRGRDQRRRVERLVRNNLALNLTRSVSEVWLLGPKVLLLKERLNPSHIQQKEVRTVEVA